MVKQSQINSKYFQKSKLNSFHFVLNLSYNSQYLQELCQYRTITQVLIGHWNTTKAGIDHVRTFAEDF